MEATSSLFSHVKQWTGVAGSIGTFLLAGLLAFGNFKSDKTHSADVQQAQQQQIDDNRQALKALQNQLNEQRAIMAAIGQFKDDTQQRFDRIEHKLDQELQFHRVSR